MARVKLFSTARCPVCDRTRRLLEQWRIPFEEIKRWIGSFAELTELHMKNGLDHLVEPADD